MSHAVTALSHFTKCYTISKVSMIRLPVSKYVFKFGTVAYSGIGAPLGTEQIMSSIPGNVRYISYPWFIEPTITWVHSGFSGYTWLDTKIVFKKVEFLQKYPSE